MRILCRTEAQVRGADILLGDVAEIASTELALASRLNEIRVAARPAFGFTRLVTQQDVLQWAIQAGLPGDSIKLLGARETVVHALVTVLEPDELRAISDPVLRAALTHEAGEIEFELSSPMQRLRVQVQLAIQLRGLGTLRTRAGPVVGQRHHQRGTAEDRQRGEQDQAVAAGAQHGASLRRRRCVRGG